MTQIILYGIATIALALVLSALLCAPWIIWHARRAARRGAR